MDSAYSPGDTLTKLQQTRNEISNIRKSMSTLKYQHKKDLLMIEEKMRLSNSLCNRIITMPPKPAEFALKPIGYLRSCYKYKNGTPRQGSIAYNSRATLAISRAVFNNPEHSIEGLSEYSHVWIIFIFDKNNCNSTRSKVCPPRLNGEKLGVFATRSPHRPNPIGLTLAKLDKIEGGIIHLSGIDILNGTPIIDLKPFIPSYDSPPIPTAPNVSIVVSESNITVANISKPSAAEVNIIPETMKIKSTEQERYGVSSDDPEVTKDLVTESEMADVPDINTVSERSYQALLYSNNNKKIRPEEGSNTKLQFVNEQNTDSNIQLVNEHTLREKNTDTKLQLINEHTLREQNTESNIQLVNEHNLREKNTDSKIQLVAEKLREQNTDSNIELLNEHNLREKNTDTKLQLVNQHKLSDQNTDSKIKVANEHKFREKNTESNIQLINEDNLREKNTDSKIQLVNEYKLREQNTESNIQLVNEHNLREKNADSKIQLVNEHNFREQDTDSNMELLNEHNLREKNVDSKIQLVNEHNFGAQDTDFNMVLLNEHKFKEQGTDFKIQPVNENDKLREQSTDSKIQHANENEKLGPLVENISLNKVNNETDMENVTECNVFSTAAWIHHPPINRIRVIFNQRALQEIEKFSLYSQDSIYRTNFIRNGRELLATINNILGEEPRSVYRRKKCSDRLYFFSVDTVHVTSWFLDDEAEVLRVRPISSVQ